MSSSRRVDPRRLCATLPQDSVVDTPAIPLLDEAFGGKDRRAECRSDGLLGPPAQVPEDSEDRREGGIGFVEVAPKPPCFVTELLALRDDRIGRQVLGQRDAGVVHEDLEILDQRHDVADGRDQPPKPGFMRPC